MEGGEERERNALVHDKLSKISCKSADETNVPVSSIDTTGDTVFRSKDLGFLSQLEFFNLRDCDLADVKPLLVEAPISPSWHWQPIAGLPTEMSEKYADMFVRVVLATFAARPPNNTTEAQRRKLAILVGVARATTTTFYGITTNDLKPGERMNPWLSATQTAPGAYSFTIGEGVPSVSRAILDKCLRITSDEREVMAAARMSAIGLLPVQGYSLFMTSHHYLDDPMSESHKAFKVMEKAWWNKGVAKNWWTTDIDVARNALWHKATHPVNNKVKIRLARDEALPARLRAAGAEAAASRLPAVEPEMRAAKSYIALLEICKPLFEMVGGSLDFSFVLKSMDMVNCFPITSQDTVPRERLPEGTPVSVNDRASALRHLADVLNRNKDAFAYCYGFYMALLEHDETIGSTSSKSGQWIKYSFSLKKLRNSNYPSFVAGLLFFSDYNVVKNKVSSDGCSSS